MSSVRKEKREIKVYVRMHDGSRQLGNVFLAADERLQDIMNDSRMFIPVHVDDQNTRTMVMLAKRYIQQIEEVRAEVLKDRTEDLYSQYGRRADDRTQAADAQVSPPRALDLELDDYRPFGKRKTDE